MWLKVLLIASLILPNLCQQKLNLRPMIGILTEPQVDWQPYRAKLVGSYVQWLTQSGARVVPVPFNAQESELKYYFSSLNGLLFTGGNLSLAADTTYFKTALTLWQLAIQANKNGDFFPMWGTCLGFQLFSILAAQDHSILLEYTYDSENLPLPLQFTGAAATSRLLGTKTTPPVILQTLTQQNTTMNLHHDGILPTTYETNQNLKDIFTLLSFNVDRNNKPFGSAMEAKEFPFYATQFHPERNQFAWGPKENLDKTPEALAVMQYLSNFFVSEARKNMHKFPSEDAATAALIYNYPPTFTGGQPIDFPDEFVYYFMS